MAKVRSRLWFCLLYEDNADHMLALETIISQFNHVGIKHDKDCWTPDDEVENPEHKAGELKKAHYHLILKFTSARWNTALAADLGIDIRFLEPCRNFDASAAYLVHDGLDDKYQYSHDELFGPLSPAVVKILNQEDEGVRVKKLLALIDGSGELDLRKLINLACDNGLYGDLRRMGFWAQKLIDTHNQQIRQLYTNTVYEQIEAYTKEKYAQWQQDTFDGCPWK